MAAPSWRSGRALASPDGALVAPWHALAAPWRRLGVALACAAAHWQALAVAFGDGGHAPPFSGWQSRGGRARGEPQRCQRVPRLGRRRCSRALSPALCGCCTWCSSRTAGWAPGAVERARAVKLAAAQRAALAAAEKGGWRAAAHAAALALTSGSRCVCTSKLLGAYAVAPAGIQSKRSLRSSAEPAGCVYLWSPRASRTPSTPRAPSAQVAAALAALRKALCAADARCAHLRALVGGLGGSVPGRAQRGSAPRALALCWCALAVH